MKTGDVMKKGKRRGFKALLAVLLTFLVIFAAAGVAGNYFLNKINKVNEVVTVPAEEEDFETDVYDGSMDILEPEDVTWNGSDFKNASDEKLINILLVGQDRREGQGRQRSDAMILCSFNPETNELSMISFLRDLYVKIPGYSDNRLNAAYVFGGFPLLTQALNENFGITVDGSFEVDFNGFKKVIDLVGGVDIELTAAEAKLIGDGAKEGVSHLDGDHALMYARIRKLDSDFGRTARQRNVLNAVFKKVKDCSVSELMELVNEVLPMITTDMSNTEILSLAVKYAPALASLKIETHSVPGDGNYRNAMIRGMAVLVPDLYEIKKQIFEEYLPL